MELQEAVKLLIKHGEIIHDLVGTPKDKKCKTQIVIDTVLSELDRQKEIKAEMRKVAFEEGFEQGRIKGIMEVAKEAQDE